RRRECESALSQLKGDVDISSLCELSASEFEKYKHLITSPVCLKRARHAVYENERTLEAASALKNGDAERFGRLMNESHISLRDNYEVSCAEMDFLAQYAWNTEGVFGARMTGGGFGGCTVNLLSKDIADDFIKNIKEEYNKKFGRQAQAYTVDVSGGARVLPID
ncbi:MAG: galactokinase, partial [Ruminococcus sp.]|nr:galactokinase [Ruminococcus sp.]